MSTFLWVIFPYIAMAVFVVGLIWRYRYDKFGWTTRSSSLYEGKLLRIASPMPSPGANKSRSSAITTSMGRRARRCSPATCWPRSPVTTPMRRSRIPRPGSRTPRSVSS